VDNPTLGTNSKDALAFSSGTVEPTSISKQMNPPARLITLERRDLASPMRALRHVGVSPLRVAIVEDDPSQAELLSHWLRRGGHEGHHFDRGATVIHALSQNSFDVLVLDWNLQDISGVELLRRIRGSGQSSVPILFASARGREEDVVSALRQGADDYMIKPVRCLEFIARLEAVARRGNHRAEPAEVLTLDVYHVDGLSRTLTRDGRAVELTVKDFDLTVLFLRNVGQLLSRSQIRERVWGRSEVVSSRTLDTHVSRIRHKLGFMPENGWRLSAKYGYGYRLQQLGAAPSVSSAA
jgi:DNA-binding response OmpR family regulator